MSDRLFTAWSDDTLGVSRHATGTTVVPHEKAIAGEALSTTNFDVGWTITAGETCARVATERCAYCDCGWPTLAAVLAPVTC